MNATPGRCRLCSTFAEHVEEGARIVSGKLASYLDGAAVTTADAAEFLSAACAFRDARPWDALTAPLTNQLIVDLGSAGPRLVARLDDTLLTIFFSETDYCSRKHEPDGIVTPRLSLGWERDAHANPRLLAEMNAHNWPRSDGFIPVLVMIGPDPVAAPVEKPFLYLARIVCLAIPPLLEVVADVADGATVVVGVGGLEIAVSAPAAKKPA
ncbi:MAG: hypothetical protein IT383_19865 [Deltaproteobacteria bacterium]|nr:hypothetical protein [Deltaproteobacteria bacterium]